MTIRRPDGRRHPRRIHRRALPVVVVGLVAAGACAHVAPGAPGDDEAEELIRLNRMVMHNTLMDQDSTLLLEHALDQYRVVAPGGRVETLRMVLDGIGTVEGTFIEISDEEVLFEGTTAVVIGKLDGDMRMEPVGELPPLKFMVVFVRADDGWRMLSRSLTPCLPVAVQRGVC